MKDKRLSVVLEFKDGFSTVTKKAVDGVKRVGVESGKAATGVRGIGSAFASAGISVDAFNSKVKKVGSSLASSAWSKAKSTLKGLALGAVATGTAMAVMGFKAASSIEQYKNTLDTVLKDPLKASATLEWANKFADITPYTNQQVMDATVSLSVADLDPTKFLGTIGDMASVMGKDLSQAIDAVIAAKNGQMQNLKAFGIDKTDVVNFGKGIGIDNFVDTKGTITDMNKFILSLTKLMEDRYSGGMERQSKTVAGLWSTILGKSQSALAKFVGMNQDGSARAGSAFEWFKSKLETVVDAFGRFEADGSLERWAEMIDKEIVPRIAQAFDTVATWIQNIKQEDLVAWGNGIKSAFEIAGNAVGYIVNNIGKAMVALGAFKLAILGARAAAGDPVAIAQLAIATAGAVVYAANNSHKVEREDRWGTNTKSVVKEKEKNTNLISSENSKTQTTTAVEKSYLNEKVIEKIKEKEEIKNYESDKILSKTEKVTKEKESIEKDISKTTSSDTASKTEKITEKTKQIIINITGENHFHNGMDADQLANRIANACMVRY